MIRLTVGLEDPSDLKRDLEIALNAALESQLAAVSV